MSVTSFYWDLRLASERSMALKPNFSSLEIETLIEELQNHKEILNSSFTNTSTNASKQRAWASVAAKVNLSLPLSLSLAESLNLVLICVFKHLFKVLYTISALLHLNI